MCGLPVIIRGKGGGCIGKSYLARGIDRAARWRITAKIPAPEFKFPFSCFRRAS